MVRDVRDHVKDVVVRKEVEMNLIDKYIAEVGKYLPRKNRADIEAEIRSTLEDMLDERKQGDGPADEATVMQLLKEYGAPRQVAATYQTHQYLIGPRLFPIFELVLRVVLIVVASASLIGLAVSLVKTDLTGPEFISTVTQWVGGLISGLIAAFGNIALIFAIIERTQVAEKFEKEFREWDPKELKSEPGPDQIDLPDHIVTIIFTALGLVVLNLYPNILSIRYSSGGTWVTIPILTDAFFRFLPWINIMGMVQILFNGYMLSQRDWSPITRALGILVDIAGMVLAVLILKTHGILGMSAEQVSALGNADAIAGFSRLFNFIPMILIILIVVATAVKVGKSLLRIFYTGTQSPYPIAK
jgi:hypothetical protein